MYRRWATVTSVLFIYHSHRRLPPLIHLLWSAQLIKHHCAFSHIDQTGKELCWQPHTHSHTQQYAQERGANQGFCAQSYYSLSSLFMRTTASLDFKIYRHSQSMNWWYSLWGLPSCDQSFGSVHLSLTGPSEPENNRLFLLCALCAAVKAWLCQL